MVSCLLIILLSTTLVCYKIKFIIIIIVTVAVQRAADCLHTATCYRGLPAVGGSVESLVLPCRGQHSEVPSGVLVLLNGLKERLEVSCPKALEREQTHRWLIAQISAIFSVICWLWGSSLRCRLGCSALWCWITNAGWIMWRFKRLWHRAELCSADLSRKDAQCYYLLWRILCSGSGWVSHFHDRICRKCCRAMRRAGSDKPSGW